MVNKMQLHVKVSLLFCYTASAIIGRKQSDDCYNLMYAVEMFSGNWNDPLKVAQIEDYVTFKDTIEDVKKGSYLFKGGNALKTFSENWIIPMYAEEFFMACKSLEGIPAGEECKEYDEFEGGMKRLASHLCQYLKEKKVGETEEWKSSWAAADDVWKAAQSEKSQLGEQIEVADVTEKSIRGNTDWLLDKPDDERNERDVDEETTLQDEETVHSVAEASGEESDPKEEDVKPASSSPGLIRRLILTPKKDLKFLKKYVFKKNYQRFANAKKMKPLKPLKPLDQQLKEFKFKK